MAQESMLRKGEEIVSTSSRLKTIRNDEMCLMVIKASGNHLVEERQSIVKPFLFVGDNYAHWKTRMRLFIQETDYEA